MLSSNATNVQHQTIGIDQSYEWGTIESKFGKIRKYAEIEYHWHGEIWDRLLATIARGGMKSMTMLYYKGATIDEATKTVTICGYFPLDIVKDKHRALWRAFFKCGEKDYPKFKYGGKIVKLPSIAGEQDSIRLFVNGQEVSAVIADQRDDNEQN